MRSAARVGKFTGCLPPNYVPIMLMLPAFDCYFDGSDLRLNMLSCSACMKLIDDESWERMVWSPRDHHSITTCVELIECTLFIRANYNAHGLLLLSLRCFFTHC